jgi:hypothetical protein
MKPLVLAVPKYVIFSAPLHLRNQLTASQTELGTSTKFATSMPGSNVLDSSPATNPVRNLNPLIIGSSNI